MIVDDALKDFGKVTKDRNWTEIGRRGRISGFGEGCNMGKFPGRWEGGGV